MEFQVPKAMRQEILMNEWDIPFRTIQKSTQEVSKERQRRMKTVNKMYQSARFDTFLRRLMLCGTSRGVQVDSSHMTPSILTSNDSSFVKSYEQKLR